MMDKKVTAMTTIITPQITPYRRQNGVTLPWRIPEMALLQKSLCNGLPPTHTHNHNCPWVSPSVQQVFFSIQEIDSCFVFFGFFMIFVLFIDLRGMRLKMEVLKTKIQLLILARRGGPYPSGHNLNLMILMFCRYGSCKQEIDEIGKEQPLIKSSFKS